MEYLKLNELTKKKLEETYIVIYAIKNEINVKKADMDLGQVFRHIFLRIFINYSSFAGAVDINIKENL